MLFHVNPLDTTPSFQKVSIETLGDVKKFLFFLKGLEWTNTPLGNKYNVSVARIFIFV